MPYKRRTNFTSREGHQSTSEDSEDEPADRSLGRYGRVTKKLYFCSSSPMMAQIEDKYSVTDIKEKPLKKKIKALWLEKFKKLKKFVSKTLKIKISRPAFSAAIVASRVTIEKASSHPEKHQDQEKHQNGNSLFADESVIRASVLEHQTTVSCIFSIPFPEPTCENAAVTPSTSEEKKEPKIVVTSDHLGDHEDQPGLKHLNQLELLHSILHDAHLTPGDDQRASTPYTKPKPSESLIAHGQRPKLRNEAEVARKSRCFLRKDGVCLSAQPPKPSSPRPREDPTKPTLEIQHYNSKPIQFIS
ncbi:hypothetical protein OUZ56_005543 [Daphnia magna]|uniref:Uncharacterized protein n=1 Tax=Daphnia magna TaxID=35525 RepID=A0ABQ9YT99_9CRUS|nr:hypothetical protein OUZ56_005543 [Daphnia magna]